MPKYGKEVIPFWPGGLRRGMAAAYFGCSASHFDKLVRDGIAPAGRVAGGVTVWLKSELDLALSELPASEIEADAAGKWDEVDIDAMIARVE